MELLVLLLVALLITIIVTPFVAMAKANAAARRADELALRLNRLERLVIQLTSSKSEPTTKPEQTAAAAAPSAQPVVTPTIPPVVKPITPTIPEIQPVHSHAPPPPVPVKTAPVVSAPKPPAEEPDDMIFAPSHVKQHLKPAPEKPTPAAASADKAPLVQWEQFMGAKLFAWVGGLALFLGVAFFVKYSFEHNLIPPQVRVGIGFLTGLCLLIGGMTMKRKETAITSQTLCSTGILILYAVTFACRSFYHFAFFGLVPTFLLMSLITVTAFLLSVRMNALVVAILGIAGGFLTPILLSTGKDAPLALFGYIALLDGGLLAVALRQRWNSLPVLGAIGTLFTQIAWVTAFFVSGRYFEGQKVLVTMAVLGGFEVLFLAAAALEKRLARGVSTLPGSTLAMGAVALLAPFYFLSFPSLGGQPVLLFSYVFLADIGVLALILVDGALGGVEAVAGVAVFVMLACWTRDFLGTAHLYAALAFYLVFAALHLTAPVLMKRFGAMRMHWGLHAAPALVLPFYFLTFHSMGDHPILLFAAVFAVGLGTMVRGMFDKEAEAASGVAGLTTFAILAMWTGDYLTPSNLHAALAFYLLFAILFSIIPVAVGRKRGSKPPQWCNAFPSLALVLVMIPVFKLTALTFLVWPLVLLIDLLAVVLAVVTAALLPILVVLLLTLAATAAWIFRIPAELTGMPTSLVLIGGFAIFFIVAAALASRKLGSESEASNTGTGVPSVNKELSVQIPTLSAALPFVLLIMLTVRLPLQNPSPVFGLALLLVVLLLGLAKIMSIEMLPAVGLGCVGALEYVWHVNHFNRTTAGVPLTWCLLFYILFTAYPFLFHRKYARAALPWGIAALAGPLHFPLIHQIAPAAIPGVRGMMGLVPAALCIPGLLGLALLVKRTPPDSPTRNAQLAWFGGSALFFITLIFPIQFSHEWITIGWALEGVALCWLFGRVPHKGLPLVGTGLLVTAFVRLALNPEVLSYHGRSSMPVLNWYLYTYGTTVACLFLAARLLAQWKLEGKTVATPLMQSLGTVLLFLLVNIEIADYFTAPGTQSLTFDFSGNFARDMSYSIAWALFALLMLIIGIGKRLAPVRYAGIGLLAVTLLKLFLHDLSQLEQLYRIGALVAVAMVSIFASFLYQRFLGALQKNDENKPSSTTIAP